MAAGKSQQEAVKFIFDGIGELDAGMNAGIAPQLLPANQAAMATNMTFRGGYGQPRPSLREIILDFGGDPVLQASCIQQPFQGACYYQPDTGQEALVAAIGGKLFQFLPQGTTCPVKDVSIPGDPNPSNVQQAWLWAAERWVVWQDGVSLPVFFDGNTSRRSNGVNKILGTTSIFFVSPAIGATVIAFLEAPYTGPTNIPVTVDGSNYILLSAASGSTSADMTPISAGSQHSFSAGDQIIAYASRVGTLLKDIPSGTTEITTITSPIVDVNGNAIPVGTIVSIGNDLWTLETSAPLPPIERGIFNVSVKLKISGAPSSVEDHPTNSLITINTSLPNPLVGTVSSDFSYTDLGVGVDIALNPTYTGPIQFVWIKDTRFQMKAIPAVPSNQVTLQNVNDTPGQNRFGNIIGIDELPAGRMGTYGLGRVWMALTDGRSFMAGDIVGGISGTQVYSFRDAILRSTENSYLVGGGNFFVPGTLGDIRALRFSATLDASLGQGPLQVFTTLAAFSCAAPVDRTTWGMITNPILTQSLLGAGALSQSGTVLANGDILFRAIDGLRSLILGRRDFDSWGNVPQSREVQPILDQDNPSLIQFESDVVFDNRSLLTCLPTNGPLGVFCQGVIALNFDPISTLRGKNPSVYDGLWTGLQIFQLVQGVFSGVDRCYAFCYDSVQSRIRLFEIQKTEDAAQYDNGTTPVTYSFESASLFNNIKGKGSFEKVELLDGELYVSDVRGVVNFEVWYKPNYSDCWTPWINFAICGNNSTTDKPRQYRTRLGLGSPDVRACDPNTGEAMRIATNFQVRIQVTGVCKIRGALFKAVKVPETLFSVPKCKELCDVVTDANTPCEECVDQNVCTQFPLVLYNLNANKSYTNSALTIDVLCPDGSTQVIPVPEGTINYTLPFPPGYTGQYPPLVMNCISGGVIVKTISSGATQDDIDLIVNEMIFECATAYAQSIAQCGVQSFSSNEVTSTHTCPDGETLQFSGDAPAWILVNLTTGVMTGIAGAFTSTVSVADATAKAQQALNDWLQQQIDDDAMTCSSGPTPLCPHDSGNSIALSNMDGEMGMTRNSVQVLAVMRSNVGMISFIDSSTDTVISNTSCSAEWDQTGVGIAYATSVNKFYASGTAGCLVFDQSGNLLTTITAPPGYFFYTGYVYDPSVDKIYTVAGNNSLHKDTIIEIDPHTDTITNSVVTTWGSTDGASQGIYVMPGKVILHPVNSYSFYNTPSLSHQGDIFVVNNSNTSEIEYVPSTGLLYCCQQDNGSNPIIGINPSTLAIEVTISPTTNFFLKSFVKYIPSTGALICAAFNGQFTVIDPVNQSIVCENTTPFGIDTMAIDYVTGLVYFMNRSGGLIHIWNYAT